MKTQLKPSTRALRLVAVTSIALGCLAFAFKGSTVPINFGNDAARNFAAESIVTDRNKIIVQLEDVVKQDVNNPDKKEAVKTAMRLLGQLRADDATPLLASHLSFDGLNHGQGITNLPSMEDFHPAVGALVKIGVPSLDTLLYQAANTDDRKNDDLSEFVIVRVLGKQPGIDFVNDTINDQRDQQARQRLSVLLSSLRKYPALHRENHYL